MHCSRGVGYLLDTLRHRSARLALRKLSPLMPTVRMFSSTELEYVLIKLIISSLPFFASLSLSPSLDHCYLLPHCLFSASSPPPPPPPHPAPVPLLPHLSFLPPIPFPPLLPIRFPLLSLTLPLSPSLLLPLLLLFLIPSHPGWPRIRGPSGAQCCFRRPREGRQNGPQLSLRQL